LKYDNLRGIYKEIAMETDLETAKKIHEMFAGQQIAFPKKLYSSEYINSFIRNHYDGKNTRELARKFNVSERRTRQIVSKLK
jgi:mor transcription activator family